MQPRLSIRAFATILACSLLAVSLARADEAGQAFFEAKIRPVLVAKCYGCHSAAAAAKDELEAGLHLDTKPGLARGGDSGVAIVPGKPSQSLLIKAIEYGGDVAQMPPDGKLSAAEIADFRRWIELGAPDPRPDGGDAPVAIQPAPSWEEAFAARRKWWSWQPVVDPPLPPVAKAAWSSHPIDRFILAKLEAHGLEPAGDADRATLYRRLSYLLTGLPPAPAELATFLADPSEQAYERAVDRLLASPHYGERFAQHWLDLVRYAESHGSEGDPIIPEAYRYRDYLIRAFNADVPYDQLVREHIAGDLLVQPRIDRTAGVNESMLGLAHFRLVEHGFQPVDALEEQARTVDNQIEVVAKTFLGLTVSCARCHDHKFDAISQRDYYAWYGIFASSRPGMVTIDAPEVLAAHQAELAKLKAEIKHDLAAAWLVEAEQVAERLLELTHPTTAPDSAEKLAEIDRAQRDAQRKLAELERRAIQKLKRARGVANQPDALQPPAIDAPRPIAAWRFEGDAQDVIGDLHGELLGAAVIRDGRLVLDGQSAAARTRPLKESLTAKTLECWLALPTLEQAGGGAMSLETKTGATFDAIVFGEQQPRHWMAGSDFFRRTRHVAGPAESAGSGELVHLAISYHNDGLIALYRNGLPYGQPYAPRDAEHRLPPFAAGDARILFGLRHTGGGKAWLCGEIEEARLYDRGLSAEEVLASYREGVGLVGTAELVAALEPADRTQRTELIASLARWQAERAELTATPPPSDPWARALAAADEDASHPLYLWVKLQAENETRLAARFSTLVARLQSEHAARADFNRQHFHALWDLTRDADYAAWFRHGSGLPAEPSRAGAFLIDLTGERCITGVYPAGVYTHLTSTKHNALFTSPRFKLPGKSLSIRMLGDDGGGVRVVVDNYPLGANGTYPQFRPTKDRFGWVRLDTSYRQGSEAYLEFATYDDLTRREKPKKMPAAKDAPPPKSAEPGRSYFGVAEVVYHDGQEPPRETSSALAPLLELPAPATRAELAGAIEKTLLAAIRNWQAGTIDDAEAAFLDAFVHAELLSNRAVSLPDIGRKVAAYRAIEQQLAIPRRAPGVLEATGHDQPLFIRGNTKTPGELVPRGFLSALGGRTYATAGTGRRELAEDLVRADNPLTSRVLVNRLWHVLLGRGIVATVDNFGRLGEQPTHPELLDHLAARFVAEKWSIKSLVRHIVTARTFRIESASTPAIRAVDPANLWLAHARVRRLEAEQIRDGVLAASGLLNPTMYGPGQRGGPLDGQRRSIYLVQLRNSPHSFLEVFDKPSPLSTRGARDVTNTPAQSLALLNSPLILEVAKRFGAQLASDREATVDARIARLFVCVLGRPPQAAEADRAAAYLIRVAGEQGRTPAAAATDAESWAELVHAVLCLKEAIYLR